MDVRQNSDGSFFISGNHEEGIGPHPDLGILDGDFYGDAAQEVAGYFERTIEDIRSARSVRWEAAAERSLGALAKGGLGGPVLRGRSGRDRRARNAPQGYLEGIGEDIVKGGQKLVSCQFSSVG